MNYTSISLFWKSSDSAKMGLFMQHLLERPQTWLRVKLLADNANQYSTVIITTHPFAIEPFKAMAKKYGTAGYKTQSISSPQKEGG